MAIALYDKDNFLTAHEIQDNHSDRNKCQWSDEFVEYVHLQSC